VGSSTLSAPGVIATATSLVTVTWALPLLEGAAMLVAVIRTLAGEGKSAGPVNMPLLSIVPVLLLPPEMPLTLQATAESPVPATVAENCAVFPSNTFVLSGVTVTVMVGGGGGLLLELAPPPPQPEKSAKAAIK
jgi:hypothetical protein